MENVSQADQWMGGELLDVDGNSVGTIQELYRDLDTQAPEWAAVRTGLFGSKLTLVRWPPPSRRESSRGSWTARWTWYGFR
jgi:hypothetical protein